MKLIQIKLFESNGSLSKEYMFRTKKPMTYFCSHDNEIKHTFINWLHENNLLICNEVVSGLFDVKVYYFDEQTLNII